MGITTTTTTKCITTGARLVTLATLMVVLVTTILPPTMTRTPLSTPCLVALAETTPNTYVLVSTAPNVTPSGAFPTLSRALASPSVVPFTTIEIMPNVLLAAPGVCMASNGVANATAITLTNAFVITTPNIVIRSMCGGALQTTYALEASSSCTFFDVRAANVTIEGFRLICAPDPDADGNAVGPAITTSASCTVLDVDVMGGSHLASLVNGDTLAVQGGSVTGLAAPALVSIINSTYASVTDTMGTSSAPYTFFLIEPGATSAPSATFNATALVSSENDDGVQQEQQQQQQCLVLNSETDTIVHVALIIAIVAVVGAALAVVYQLVTHCGHHARTAISSKPVL